VGLPVAVLLLAAVIRLAGLADVPPGLQHDEVFRTMFVEQVRAGELPIYFDLNGGNEPFFAYLVTATLTLMGPNVLALRLPAVAGGLIGVAALWWVARRMWGVRVAALATLLMAVSLWHTLDSRVSLRAIWLPAIMTLAYGFLWSWFQTGSRRRLLVGALLLGLSLYTYTSSALGVVAVLIFGSLSLLRRETRRAGTGLVAAGLLALAMGLPLALHVSRTPQAAARVQDLSYELTALRDGNPLPVLTSAAKVAGMFAFTGDPEWRYNVAGRPVFSLGVGLAFYVGVWACWRGRRQPQYLFLLLWLLVNLGASAVTSSAPSSLRAVGAAPAAFTVAAIGCWALWGEAVRRGWRAPAGIVLGLALAVEAALGPYGYFVTWPRHPEVREIYRADLAEMARFLGKADWPGQVLLSAEYAADLDRLSFEYLGFTAAKPRYFDGSRVLVVPAEPTLVMVPRLRPIAPALAAVLEERGHLLAREASFDAWELQPAVGAVETVGADAGTPVLAPWPGPALEILEVRLPEEVEAGDDLAAVVRFEVTAPAPGGRNVKLFAHLHDSAGFGWSQADVLTYPTSDWRVGDQVYQALPVPVPGDMPSGEVLLDVGVYEDPAQPFQLLLGAEGRPFTRLSVGASRVVDGDTSGTGVPSPEVSLDLTVGEGRLTGASVAPRVLQPGLDVDVSLWWEGAGPTPVPVTWSLRREGESVALQEAARGPWAKAHPDRVLRDRRRLTVPVDAPRGEWELVAEVGADGAETSLGMVFVAGLERDFSAPAPGLEADVEFEGQARLVGLAQAPPAARPGGELIVELLWDCLAPLDRDYTVFVQLVNAEGRTLASHDGPPASGTRPTRGWLPGETVHDVHTLTIPPDTPAGTYSLIAGLYRADAPGYPRLSVSRASTPATADAAIITSIEVSE
jgi:4-amino-4-deoxy-L-arabinose transferase-like glycosyltransferase